MLAGTLEHAGQLVDILDPEFTEEAGKRGGDPPAAAFSQGLSGTRIQQVGNNGVGSVF